ncbi:hypothetical protein L083_2957 [Actinoplanes sp. N902-109]|nr:hypothetical protein L083_2957 [Actinoplanes sp. N902-109]
MLCTAQFLGVGHPPRTGGGPPFAHLAASPARRARAAGGRPPRCARPLTSPSTAPARHPGRHDVRADPRWAAHLLDGRPG